MDDSNHRELVEGKPESGRQISELRKRVLTAAVLVVVVVVLFLFATLNPAVGKPILFCTAFFIVSLAAIEASLIAAKRYCLSVGIWFGIISLSLYSLELWRVLSLNKGISIQTSRGAISISLLGALLCFLPTLFAHATKSGVMPSLSDSTPGAVNLISQDSSSSGGFFSLLRRCFWSGGAKDGPLNIGQLEAVFASSVIQGGLIILGGILIISVVDVPALFFLLLVSVASNDIAAYFIGRKLGGPKIAPIVSPKKTWSGSIFGLLVGVSVWKIVVFLLPWLSAGALLSDNPKLLLWSTAVFVIIGAQMGDLLKSLVKRGAGVKDSGNFLPGHGGFLDRIDGLLGAVVVLALYL